MNLVIVESPTKAKTIGKFLGPDYHVESSFGHIRDLPKSKLGVDPEHDFEPHYVIPTKARKTVNYLKKLSAKSTTVILATDEDREGEAIAWHLAQALNLDGLSGTESKVKEVKRIVFHEITESAIQSALRHPRGIDQHLVDAQQARRILDRIVGYQLSPFLWKKVARRLSAGRVQSAALRLVVDREKEIRAFKPDEYWTIDARLLKGEGVVEAHLTGIGDRTLEKLGIKTETEAKTITGALQKSRYQVSDVTTKELKRNPSPPFTTSTLQQEAAKRLGFSARKTMLHAQHLYENGHITYMRTDSVNLSKESLVAARSWLEANLGAAYAAEAPRTFTAKSKLVQEAHEAVRPTNVQATPEAIGFTDPGETKLYRLIWQRFVASQMPQARVASTTVEIGATPEGKNAPEYTLRASGQRITFDGFLKIWPAKLVEREVPPLTVGDNLTIGEIVPSQHFTEPPPRYSEATLIKTLEEYGIGRPSTYAPIIYVLQARNYAVKEQGRFHPTEIGELVNQVLVEHFPEIVDIQFTAKMEESLDGVAAGVEYWRDVLRAFYDPFARHLAAKYEEVSKQVVVNEETKEVCEKCGRPMVIKFGRFGKFLACSGFPECKNAKPLSGALGGTEGPKSIGMKCPKCGEGEVVIRRVHRGRARGKIFWGCNCYPKCDYASWTDPTKPAPAKPEKKDPNLSVEA